VDGKWRFQGILEGNVVIKFEKGGDVMEKAIGLTKRTCGSAGLCYVVAACLFLISGTAQASAASTQTGVVATVAADYSSSALSVITVDPKAGPRVALNNQLPSATSDIRVRAFGPYYYRLGGYQADNITKVAVNAPNTPIWQYSTLDEGETDSNPCDLVFVSSQKAYLLRYGSTKAWIVNPSTTTEAGFKIGELDLSAYADADGVPEMGGGVIANGKLFIILQRMDSSFCPSNTAYVAVFDVATNAEIDTGLGQGNMKGIPLSIKDPMTIRYVPHNNTVYVQGEGSFPGFCDPIYDYTGGIVSINPQTYATAVVLDDGDTTTHPYGLIAGMLIASSTKGYFVGYEAWGDNTLYQFNPTTGAVAGALQGFQHISIAGMEPGIYLDRNNMMWVCNQTNATVDIVDTENNTLSESLNTNLNPQNVAFCTSGTPLAPILGSSLDGSTVSVYWNTCSGAEGYYLLASIPAINWSLMLDVGTRTRASGSFSSLHGVSIYVIIIPYNAQGFGEASNVARIAFPAAE